MFTRRGQPLSPPFCDAVCWGRVGEATVQLSPLLLHFQSLHPFPVYNWHPFSCCPGSCSHSGKGCVHSRTMGPFQWIFLRDQQLLPPPQPPLFFTARSYEVLFPSAGTLGGVVWPGDGISCFPDVSPHQFLSATCECRTMHSASHCCCCLVTSASLQLHHILSTLPLAPPFVPT